ncbi:MAG: OmpA family protein [Magnetovibrio sp.]|nr:OmpA family protein [Magnetovibrio sp.]
MFSKLKRILLFITTVTSSFIITSQFTTALAQDSFGNETVFSRTPTVNEINQIFAKKNKPKHRVRKIMFNQPNTPAVQEQAQQNDEPRQVSLNINFALNSVKIAENYEKALSNFAKSMEQNPQLNFEIGGHADSSGNPAMNMELSKQRAESVRQYLVSVHQIDPQRLTSAGFGETRPLSGLSSTNPRNRRVSFMYMTR